MRTLTTFLGAALITLLFGCAQQSRVQPHREEVAYYDRNGDGKVDREVHHFPGMVDVDWELRDDDYDGMYEKKISYSFTVKETVVDIPVPTGVKIEKK